MTERKWTPGEWVVGEYSETRGGGYLSVKSSNFHWVCNVHDYSDGTITANAHLIAAAPDLYEALEGLRKWQDPCGVDPDIDAALRAADAALSKARGES